MRLIRVEKMSLYKVVKSIGSDGDNNESYIKQKDYDCSLQFLDDAVTAEIYGANVSKTFRIKSINSKLEQLLLPKVNNKQDNISNYLIEYKDNKYAIQRVTPGYIDISWR